MDSSVDANTVGAPMDSDLQKTCVPEIPGVNPVVNWTVCIVRQE